MFILASWAAVPIGSLRSRWFIWELGMFASRSTLVSPAPRRHFSIGLEIIQGGGGLPWLCLPAADYLFTGNLTGGGGRRTSSSYGGGACSDSVPRIEAGRAGGGVRDLLVLAIFARKGMRLALNYFEPFCCVDKRLRCVKERSYGLRGIDRVMKFCTVMILI
jgi:hypothetical protein